nr:RHS repeat-associated core domain-containing protein [Allocatelliglobosispora scoriae]
MQGMDPTYGTVSWSESLGDINESNDEKCITHTYNRNITKNILTTVSRTTTTALPCAQAPSTVNHMITDVRNYYDGAASSTTAPLYGTVTKTEQLKDWLPGSGTVWQVLSQSTYDKTGRPLTLTDLKGNTSSTVYQPTVGGPVTKTTATGPAPFSWSSVTEVNPYWGSVTKTVDFNTRTTGEATFDALGRTAKTWKLGWPRAGNENKPSAEFVYTLPPNRDAYSSIESRLLNADGNYISSFQILDGMLRARQVQAIAMDGSGNRVVSDTIYDDRGRVSAVYQAHGEPGAPSSTLWWEPQWSVPTVAVTEYDRASRPVASVVLEGDGVSNLVEKYRTTTAYEGNVQKVTPPEGGIARTVISDAAGRTVELRQHTSATGVNGPYLKATYAFDRQGQMSKAVDNAGNEWVYTYDPKGRKKTEKDPDKGTTLYGYNDFDELIQTTDGAGEVLFYVYDQLGRKKEMRDDTASGALRAEWKYDSLYTGQTGYRGQVTQAIRYEPAGSANAYQWQVRGFNSRYQPSGVNIVIPAVETDLSGTYIYGYGYSQYTGSQKSISYPAVGDVPNETVTTEFDDATGAENRIDTNWVGQSGTMASNWYTAFGELQVSTRKMPTGVYVDDMVEYETASRRVSRTMIQPETGTGLVSDRRYKYDFSGNIVSIEETPQVGAYDLQCFSYDKLARLTTAWTPKATVGCGPAASKANLGTTAPYWQQWGFDALNGNRTSETSYGTVDTTRQYTLPAGGQNVVRPHSVSAMTTTVTGQAPVTVNYGYNGNGAMTCRPAAAGVNTCGVETASQILRWNAEGSMDQATVNGAVTETALYDANGQRLVRRDPTGTTVYLPGQEVRREGGVTKGTRYYSLAGRVIGCRTGAGLAWTFPDHQTTQQIAVEAGTQAVTIRRQTPYGAARGVAVTWPNGKGFVGGDNDPTGLVNLGARQYDGALGRFVSVDPLMDLGDPQSWHGYSYTNSNPITKSDPSGLRPVDPELEAMQRQPVAPQKALAVAPTVQNPKLQKVINDLYKVYTTNQAGGNIKTWVGDGTAMDALEWELKTGLRTRKTFHYQDILDNAAEMSKILEGDVRAHNKIMDGHKVSQVEYDSLLSSSDVKTARSIFDRMWKVLGVKDTAGVITAEINATPERPTQVKAALESIKERYAVSDTTGEKFQINVKGNPERVVPRGAPPAAGGGTAPGRASGGGRVMGRIGGAMSILDFGIIAYYIYQYGPGGALCILTGMNCPIDPYPA